MQSTDKYKNVSKQLVYKWHADLQTDILVDDRHARIKSKLRPSRTSLNEIAEVAVSAGCSKSTAQRVLTAYLGLSHVSARWEPRLLTEEEKSARVDSLRRFLDIRSEKK